MNLARGARRAAARLPLGPDAVLAEALAVRDEEIASSAAMAARGADLIGELCGPAPRLLTHCNTGGLASVTGGTALAVVIELHRRGALGGVIASETRPLLQGARLTAWELGRAGVPFRVAVDGAGPYLMARGDVDAVILGADRVCANGDVVNKIGTYAHALGARAAGIPFVVVAPESTVDDDTPAGSRRRDRGPGRRGGGGRPAGGEPRVRRDPARPGDGDRDRATGVIRRDPDAGTVHAPSSRSRADRLHRSAVGGTAVTQPPARPRSRSASASAGRVSGFPAGPAASRRGPRRPA